MSLLSRSSQIAISAMGCLAEVHPEPGKRLTAADIASARRLPKPFVAKVLTALSRVNLIEGSPGPRGGFRLAATPQEISLDQVVAPFEREDELYQCPYGPQYCGVGEKCPLHDHIVLLRDNLESFLRGTTLAAFVGRSPTAAGPIAR